MGWVWSLSATDEPRSTGAQKPPELGHEHLVGKGRTLWRGASGHGDSQECSFIAGPGFPDLMVVTSEVFAKGIDGVVVKAGRGEQAG